MKMHMSIILAVLLLTTLLLAQGAVVAQAHPAEAGVHQGAYQDEDPPQGGVSGNIFEPLRRIVRDFGGQIFVFLTDMIIIVVAIVGVSKCLQGAASGFLGLNGQAGAAIIGFLGLVMVVVMTFVVLPELVGYLGSIRPEVPF